MRRMSKKHNATNVKEIQRKAKQIVARQNQLNARWGDLRERAEAKREELSSAHGVQTFHIECRRLHARVVIRITLPLAPGIRL